VGGRSPAIKRVERVHRSLGCVHLYQREIANAAEWAEEVAASVQLFNEVRPNESLGQRGPYTLCTAHVTRFGADSPRSFPRGTVISGS
jgi:hypothetical protein